MSEPGRHDFETVGSETVYSGAILALRLDQVSMPGGRVAEREVIEHHGAVAIVAVDDGSVVLVDQYRHPIGRRLLELPAGLLDEIGENPVEAAARELAEETGLRAQTWSLLVDVVASPGFTDESVRIYLAEGLSSTDRPEPENEEADIRLVRMPVPDAVAAVLSGRIVNASAVAGILALAAVRPTGDVPTQRAVDSPWEDLPTSFESRQRRG